MQVQDVAVSITGQRVLLILPHSQDIGRFYAFTRVWQRPALQLVRLQAKATAQAVSALAAHLRGPTDTQQGHALAASALAGKPEPGVSSAGPAHDLQPRVHLSMSLSEAAVRMESHSLERKLSIVRSVRSRTAAAMITLDSAMGEYDRMAKTSAARAAAKKPSIAASMLTQEIQDSSAEVRERLTHQLVSQDRYGLYPWLRDLGCSVIFVCNGYTTCSVQKLLQQPLTACECCHPVPMGTYGCRCDHLSRGVISVHDGCKLFSV